MEVRFACSPRETAAMNTQELRTNFLVERLMMEDEVVLLYTHYDRVIIGGVKPVQKTLALDSHPELKAAYFLERRELGIINVGGDGMVIAGDKEYAINKLDCLYIGKGVSEVYFKSKNPENPALFYLLSAPAHQSFPIRKLAQAEVPTVSLGEAATANQRTLYKYIHADGIQSAQLVMGLTVLQEGSVWNTMPAHTHSRRMEAYFYFDVPQEQRVFHLMGTPQETRHLLVANHEAIISPPWSIHSGCGTSNYGFIWGMAGENASYTDMDPVPLNALR